MTRKWLGLGIVLATVLLVSMDGSILFLTMPSLSEALAPTAEQALWILDIYSFMVAPLLITTGNLSDRYGKLRILMIGVTIFGIGSLAAAFAPTAEVLIAARALMGIGGGALLPTTLAVIGNLFRDPTQLSRAIGLWTAFFAVGFAVGPVVAGILLAHFWWGSVFLINIPVVVAFLVLAPIVLKEGPTTSTRKVDLASSLLSMVGILGTVYALKHLAGSGISWELIPALLIGGGAITLFVRRQRRLSEPLVDFSLFHNRGFAIAILAAAASMFGLGAAGYLTGIYLQSVLGFDALTAGLLGLPSAIVIGAFSIAAGRLAMRFGTKNTLIVAFLAMTMGLAIVAFTGFGLGIPGYLVGMSIGAVGFGTIFALASEAAVTAVPPARTGSAAALSETSFELGQASGIALLGSLAALLFRVFGPGIEPTMSETASAGTATIAQLTEAASAFSVGLLVALLVAAAVSLVLAGLAASWMPRDARRSEPELTTTP